MVVWPRGSVVASAALGAGAGPRCPAVASAPGGAVGAAGPFPEVVSGWAVAAKTGCIAPNTKAQPKPNKSGDKGSAEFKVIDFAIVVFIPLLCGIYDFISITPLL